MLISVIFIKLLNSQCGLFTEFCMHESRGCNGEARDCNLKLVSLLFCGSWLENGFDLCLTVMIVLRS